MLPPLLLGSGLLALLALIAAAVGRRMLAWLSVRPESAGERLLLVTGLGVGMVQFLPFTLLAFGAANTWTIRAAVVLAIALTWRDLGGSLLDLRQRLGSVLRPRPPAGHAERRPQEVPPHDGGAAVATLKAAPAPACALRRPAWVAVAIVMVCAAVSAVYLRALCPITDDDGLSYHLTAALRMFAAGRFVYIPTLTYANWPQGVESLFVLLLGLTRSAPIGLVQFLYGVLTVGAVYTLARHIGGWRAGITAAALMLAYKVFWEEMAAAHVDLGTALFATLAVLVFVRAQGAGSAGWLRLSAIFAGLAATAKLNGAWVIVAMSAVVLFSPGGVWRERSQSAALYAAIGACVVLPWFVRTWLTTGNPIYPMAYGLFGGREWTAGGWPRLQYYFLLMNTPPGMAPTRPNLLLGRAVLAGCAFVVAVAVFRITQRSALAVPARYAIGFTAMLLLGSGYNLRFLLPAYPCVVVCGACGLVRLQRGLPVLVPALAALLGLRVALHGPDPDLATAVRVSAGLVSADQYLRDQLPDYRTVEYANAYVPPGARILVATWQEATAYYRPMALRANYWLQDSVHYDSPAHLDADLARLGVEYLVYKPMDTGWCSHSSVCAGRMSHETAAVADLLRRRGVRMFEANGYGLYHLQ